MPINDTVLNAALAGLLHDIGKFMWRARMKELRQQHTQQEVEKKYRYWHALAGEVFLTNFMHADLRKGLSGVCNHHLPDPEEVDLGDPQPWIVKQADQLASAERDESEDEFVPRLLSIFARLKGHNAEEYLPLKRLNPFERLNLFPKNVDVRGKQAQFEAEYSQLWKDFEQACKDANLASITDPNLYLETILALLQEHTWCVPSTADEAGPDISLFDHLRVTAAIAACLAADGHDNQGKLQPLKDSQQKICLLVWADLSGLQKFIYSLASEGAAKSLRARSFYVQLLCEGLAHAIVDALGLPITNLIYVGGGGFQLLAPLAAEKSLPDIVTELTERLLIVHQGDLGLTVEYEQVMANEFQQFSAVYDRLGKKLNIAKRRPFVKASAQALFEAIGRPLTQGGDPLKFCIVTGEDGDNLVRFDKDSERFKSEFVDSLEKLGLDLPSATHIALARVDPAKPARAIDWQEALKTFGYSFQISTDPKKGLTLRPINGEFVRVWHLKPLALNDAQLTLPSNALRVASYRPFARLTPKVYDPQIGRERPKTFDELAKKPVHQNSSFERWGVLRMDVDNLGTLFKDGFGANASLARIASLSFALRLFFEGHLPELANGKPDGDITERDLSSYLYIQYSGGDDIFVVGAWDALPEFARRIRTAFGEYAAQNPGVTISGGMDIFHEKYPLYLAAEDAGEAESQAKDMDGKDAFCFLSVAAKWNEFDTARQRAYRLATLVETRQAPRSLIQNLLMLYAEHKTNIKNSKYKTKPWYGRWMWLAAYQLTRLVTSLKKDNEQARKEVEDLRNSFTSKDADLAHIALSARWAQFLTRGG